MSCLASEVPTDPIGGSTRAAQPPTAQTSRRVQASPNARTSPKLSRSWRRSRNPVLRYSIVRLPLETEIVVHPAAVASASWRSAQSPSTCFGDASFFHRTERLRGMEARYATSPTLVSGAHRGAPSRTASSLPLPRVRPHRRVQGCVRPASRRAGQHGTQVSRPGASLSTSWSSRACSAGPVPSVAVWEGGLRIEILTTPGTTSGLLRTFYPRGRPFSKSKRGRSDA